MAEGKTNKENKMKISISISKYLKEKLDELVNNGEFSSVSEIVNIAVVRFLTEYEREKKLS
ncbi:ribbon-helix-helix domain-containing protein [Geoglobus ahangari]